MEVNNNDNRIVNNTFDNFDNATFCVCDETKHIPNSHSINNYKNFLEWYFVLDITMCDAFNDWLNYKDYWINNKHFPKISDFFKFISETWPSAYNFINFSLKSTDKVFEFISALDVIGMNNMEEIVELTFDLGL